MDSKCFSFSLGYKFESDSLHFDGGTQTLLPHCSKLAQRGQHQIGSDQHTPLCLVFYISKPMVTLDMPGK